jgi:hypothetical protein
MFRGLRLKPDYTGLPSSGYSENTTFSQKNTESGKATPAAVWCRAHAA